MQLFNGCGVALVTPFKNGSVDFDAFNGLLDRLLTAGVSAVIPCGTTGEPATMTEDEWKSVISCTVKKVNGAIPVIAGTGTNNTAKVIEKARIAKDLGADAQLCVTPYYNKTTQDGLVAHFEAIADDGALPVYLYNVPSRTGLDMQAATCARLAKHQNIIALKDATGDMKRALELKQLCPDDFAIYSGDDFTIASSRILGYSGVISVAANIVPEQVVKMYRCSLEECGQIQNELFELIRLLFCETSPVPCKAAMSMLGQCSNELRLPLIPMSNANAQKLHDELVRLKLL